MTTKPRATAASSPLAGLVGVDRDVSASADGPRERRAPGSEGVGLGSRQEVIQGYERSPKDVLRVVVFAATTLVLLAVTLWAEDAVLGFERDLIALLAFLSSSVERVVHGVLVVAMLLVQVVALVVPLVLRRYRLFGYLFGAIVLSGIARPSAASSSPIPSGSSSGSPQRVHSSSSASPSRRHGAWCSAGWCRSCDARSTASRRCSVSPPRWWR